MPDFLCLKSWLEVGGGNIFLICQCASYIIPSAGICEVSWKGGSSKPTLCHPKLHHLLLQTMPFEGPRRSKHQKAQTTAMQKRWWSQKSCAPVTAVDPTSCRLLSKERRKAKQELGRARRSDYNSRRREKRAQQKLKEAECESQARIEEVVEERCRSSLMELRKETEGLKGEKESLKKEKEKLKKDLARLKACNRREPSRVHREVQKALEHARASGTTLPTVRYVKDRRGIVQDWAQNAMITLVNEGVPISKTWSVMKTNATALGVTIVGKWSTWTSGRVVREGGFAAGLMIVEYVQKCIGS